VGTFYEATSPSNPPFVRIGEHVNLGKVLCIIESMKLMNEIETDIAGIVETRLVQNGQPVEYGEALFGIRPFRKILIANRGEIALRIICACKDLGFLQSRSTRKPIAIVCRCVLPIRPSALARRRARAAIWTFRRLLVRGDCQCGCDPPRLRLSQRERRVRRGLPSFGIKFIGPTPEVISSMGLRNAHAPS